MAQEHRPRRRTIIVLTALPSLAIWIAAIITLVQRRPSVLPLERPLAWLLTIGTPIFLWLQFRD